MAFRQTTTLNYDDLLSEKTRINYIRSACTTASGIYFYKLRERPHVKYPFGSSNIVYIGKASNLRNRLVHHFSVDMKLILPESYTLQWSYQNYFLKKSSTETDIVVVENKDYNQLELLLISLFFIKHGAPPLCNGLVMRDKLVSLFKEVKPDFRNDANGLLTKVEYD